MTHLYTVHTADGAALDAWACSPWQACALLGVRPDQVVNITMVC